MTQRLDTAVFIARARWEDGQFWARISYSVEIDSEPTAETRIVTVDPAEVRQHLAIWLDQSVTAAST